MHTAHQMSGMLWSMVLLGTMPYLLAAVGVIWYLRTRKGSDPETAAQRPGETGRAEGDVRAEPV